MKKEIVHVELLDKLEKKEMYDKMDFIDIFMYNHHAQDKYYRQQKYQKLKQKAEKLELTFFDKEQDEISLN